jgi:hypothetical protein
MTQYIIDTGAVPDDGQGDPLRTAFTYTNQNFTQIFAAGPVGSNVQIGNTTITTNLLNSNLILSPSGIGRIQFNNTLFPRIDNVYDIGTPSLRFNSIYLGDGGIDVTGGITTAGNIQAGYFIGNGSQLTGIVASTGSEVVNGNSNINIPSAGSNIFVTVNGTGNVTTFANTGMYVAGQVSATGNITGNYILGNGALLTGINIGYGNSNVANFLPTYTGNLVSLTGPVVTTANVVAGNILSSGTISATGNIIGGNINTGRLNAGYITTGTTISALGNISTNSYFIGDGSLLTNLPVGNYSNANVAAFLPTYTGNLASLTGPVTTTANITAGNILTTGLISATGIEIVGNLRTDNVNANTVTVDTSVSAAGNIIGNNLVGNTVSTSTITATANIVGGNIATSGQLSVTGNIRGGNLAVPGGTVESYIVSATGRIQGNNFVTSGTITATGNITGGNVTTANVQAANVNVTRNISAIGNVYANNFVGNGITTLGNISANNITASANVRAGNVIAVGLISTTGNVASNYFIGNGALLTGITVSGGTSISNGNSNVVVSLNANVDIGVRGVGNVATFANTGAYVTGELSATGNILGNGFLSDNYYYANGVPVPFGITYTAAPAPLPDPRIGDQWWDTDNDVLYEYISDGVSEYWVDTTSPAFAGGVVADVAISGNMLPVANTTFNIGSTSSYFNRAYLQAISVAGNVVAGNVRSDMVIASVVSNVGTLNLQTNGTNALTIDSSQNITTYRRLAASSMPAGAVVQTVMSASLGGSITNSTTYTDVSFATVSITPSSATNKIMILATGTSTFTPVATANVTADTQLVRSPSTSLQIQSYGSQISGGGIGTTGSVAYSYTDSPGTTATVTYKLQQRVSNSSSTLTSTNIWLIAMEITA